VGAISGTVSRSGSITIADKTFNVTQTGVSCSYSISPTVQGVAFGGGTATATVTASTGCAWTAKSNSSWITVTAGASGSGNGSVTYKASANSGAGRSGSLTIAGKTLTVGQAAVNCAYAISPGSQSVGSGSATGSVNVTTSASCGWGASSNASWITLTSGAGGTVGNGKVNYSVQANTTGASRSGTVAVADKTFTVTQAK
jgi:hypothetical protein